jgi:hypothetical protein
MRTRLDLNLEDLQVESTEMVPTYVGPEGLEGFEPYPVPAGFAASILWNTQTQPIVRDTNSSPCIA